MFNRIHQKLGTAGFIISIVALVAALGGGAYAASGGLSGKQKKEVEKIAKKNAGRPGKNGAPGATGPAGPVGAKGEPGAPGANGTGTAGSNGVSPTGTAFTGERKVGSTTCKTGGVEYKGATTNLVCNGSTSGELAPGATEAGTWSLTPQPSYEPGFEPSSVYMPISFPSPLPEGEAPLQVVFMPEFENPVTGEFEFAPPTAECPGNAEEPKAAEGYLCVYATPSSSHHLHLINGKNPNVESPSTGAGPNGTILEFEYFEIARGIGTWAATAAGS
jgi:hypothetical protein